MARNRNRVEETVDDEAQVQDTEAQENTSADETGETDADNDDTDESTPVAPPLTGEERLRSLEDRITSLENALHGLASQTSGSAEAHKSWLDNHFPNRNPGTLT